MTNINFAMAFATTSTSTALPIPTTDAVIGGRIHKQRSPLVQILKEVPGYSYTATATATKPATTATATCGISEPNQQQQQQQKWSCNVARVTGGVENLDLNVPIPRFPTSKLAGRLSTVGNGMRGVGNSCSGAAMPQGNNTTRLSSCISGNVHPAEVQPSGRGEVREILSSMSHAGSSVPVGPIAPASAVSSYSKKFGGETVNPQPTKSSVAFSVPLQEESPPHLPTVKKPSLSSELRRRVLFNNTSPRLKDHQKNQQTQETIVRAPARAPSRQTSRGGKSLKGARVRTKSALVGTESGEVTKLVKGLCQTEDETVVREKVRQLLKEEKRAKTRGNANYGESQQQHFLYSDVPDSTTTNVNDTRTTGTATKNLRRHFTHQKMSHKREVLERAFGWHSQFIDDLEDIDEELGRQAAALEIRNQELNSPVPVGESASGNFVGAVKVAGSIGSKASSGGLPRRGNEWIDEEEQVNVDMVMAGVGAVRKGKRGKFQLDQGQAPQIPLVRSRRKQRHSLPLKTNTRSHNSVVLPGSLNSNILGAKRSLQRFDRVEDWLVHQQSHSGGSNISLNGSPTSLDNVSTQTAKPTTPKSVYTRSSHKTISQQTSCAAQFERKYPLSLARLPYLKHILRSGGKGTARNGGIVTISPPTDSDLLGYIQLDIKGKRYMYTIIPGLASGNEITEKNTMIIVHPRQYKNNNNLGEEEEEEEETIIAQDKSQSSKEHMYALSELPGKHLGIVKFASKFIGIVRRGTVLVRIEGLNPGSPIHGPTTTTTTRTKSGGTSAATAAKTTKSVKQSFSDSQPSNSLWEWYRAEIYADGRFEFTIIPRGGVVDSATIKAENGGEMAGAADGTIMLVGGVMKIKFMSMPSSSTTIATIATTTTNATDDIDGNINKIPRFCGGNPGGSARGGNIKFRRVHVEISRTLAATTTSSSSAVPPSAISRSSSKPKSKTNIKSKSDPNTKMIWAGIVELGPGSSPDVGVTTSSGNRGGSGSELICGGFMVEVDWARRMWIECRRKAGNLGNNVGAGAGTGTGAGSKARG